MNVDYESKVVQFYVPSGDEYVTNPNLIIESLNNGMLESSVGLGMPSVSYVTYRSPSQNGTSVVNLFRNEKNVSLSLIENFISGFRKEWVVHELKKAFSGGRTLDPLTRKFKPLKLRETIYPGRAIVEGSNATYDPTTEVLTVPNAGFVTWGGFNPLGGDSITVASNPLKTVACLNDFQLNMGPIPLSPGIEVPWIYNPHSRYKELNLVFSEGFPQNQGTDFVTPIGFFEIVNFTCHDPFWYGPEQYFECSVETVGALVYDEVGAWYHPQGQWLFEEGNVKCEFTIYYEGTQRAKPIIDIIGPTTTAKIRNLTSGVLIEYVGDIEPKQKIRIDFKNNTVTDLETGDNLLHFLKGPLTTFAIETDFIAKDGVNDFLVLLDEISPESKIIIRWQNVFD